MGAAGNSGSEGFLSRQAVDNFFSRREKANKPLGESVSGCLLSSRYDVTHRPVRLECAQHKQPAGGYGELDQKNSSPQDLIATNDIGAIGFIADRAVFDLQGLINPEIIPQIRYKHLWGERDEDIMELLRLRRPDYLVVHPGLYPTVIENKRLFKRVYSNKLRINTICVQDEMIAYKADWGRTGQGPAPYTRYR